MGFSPAAGIDPTMQLKSVIGSAGALGKLNTILSLAENKNQITIISNPKITVVNNKEAFIVQGRKIPYYTNKADSRGNVNPSVEYVDANLELKVTPQVSAEGTVLMTLSVQKNIPLPTQAGLPPEIDVKSSNTEVMVNNGETIVLGGIYQDSKENGESGVPILKDIPLLGWLFKSWNKVEMRKELLIFVTPKVIANAG